MSLKTLVRKWIHEAGFDLYNRRQPTIYSEDGLSTYHVHSFCEDDAFQRAYQRGIKANQGIDNKMQWRTHVALWAAGQALRVPGAFVECGVNNGCLMSAIFAYHDWNTQDRQAFLIDTFGGFDERYLSDGERDLGRLEWYQDQDMARVQENFAEWTGVEVVKGVVPEVLTELSIETAAFVSLDMNCAAPEEAAFDFFWPRLSPGGVILMDDFAYRGYEEQHEALSAAATRAGTAIVSLPTGQGMAIKS